jgi:hypothetical protein
MKRFVLIVVLTAIGCKPHLKDPVELFKGVVRAYSEQTNSTCYVGMIGQPAFNVVKTDSLVSPYAAVVGYDKGLQLTSNGVVRISMKALFAFQENKWVYKNFEVDDHEAKPKGYYDFEDDMKNLFSTQNCEIQRWQDAANSVWLRK